MTPVHVRLDAPPDLSAFVDIVGPDLATFVEMLAGPLTNALFGFVESWWDLRRNENVLFVHFNELKQEPEAAVRRQRPPRSPGEHRSRSRRSPARP